MGSILGPSKSCVHLSRTSRTTERARSHTCPSVQRGLHPPLHLLQSPIPSFPAPNRIESNRDPIPFGETACMSSPSLSSVGATQGIACEGTVSGSTPPETAANVPAVDKTAAPAPAVSRFGLLTEDGGDGVKMSGPPLRVETRHSRAASWPPVLGTKQAGYGLVREDSTDDEDSDLDVDGPTTSEPTAVAVSAADAAEPVDQRVLDAVAWTNKEVRKLIAAITRLGSLDGTARPHVKFGVLFEATANLFEALSGTCRTARRVGVVQYDVEHLWQGRDDDVVVTLLKDTHDTIPIPMRPSARSIATLTRTAKSTGFDRASLASSRSMCHKCGTVVYPIEYVCGGDRVFHSRCFRCASCKRVLRGADYCVSADGQFRCAAHHRVFEMSQRPAMFERRFEQRKGSL
eukprot:m.346400 g.346400  ORF g.346400 m.346400 type:complete len:403 (+) comp27908_c0_seq1:2-1210(+)